MKKLNLTQTTLSLLSVLSLGACGLLVDNSPGLNDGKKAPSDAESSSEEVVNAQATKSLLEKIDGVDFKASKVLCKNKEGKIGAIEIPLSEGAKIQENTFVFKNDKANKNEATLTYKMTMEVSLSEGKSTLHISEGEGKLTEIQEITKDSASAQLVTTKSVQHLVNEEPKDALTDQDKVPSKVTLTLSNEEKTLTITDEKVDEKDTSCGDKGQNVGAVYEKK